MTEIPVVSPSEKETLSNIEFDGGSFVINALSDSKEGFKVKTRNTLFRTQLNPDQSFSTESALSENQKVQLRQGMANEVFFSLPNDFPQEKKEDVKKMFSLIDEVSVLKRNNEVDSNYTDKLYQLEKLRRELRPLLQKANLTENLGVKVGIRNLKIEGNTLSFDAKPISYPVYAVASSHEDTPESLNLGAVTGTAAILITADKKIILQHRSSKNSPYGDVPGASFAGMLDAEFEREIDPQTGKITKRTGKIKPLTDIEIKKSSSTEREQEIGLTDDDLSEFRILGAARDKIRVHDEFLLLAKTNLSASEVKKKAEAAPRSKNLRKLNERGDFHFEENFITIDATAQAIETLLTEVKCPLPPTHTASFIAAGYNLLISEQGREIAEKWKDEMQEKVKKNYAAINHLVQEYYRNNPSELNNNKPGKPKRNPLGYEPYYTPQEQGLPDLKAELLRTHLISPSQA